MTVSYDRNELQVNELLQVHAAVELAGEGEAQALIVDLGLPPGFAPLTEDLDALVEEERIERYELTGQSIVLYLAAAAAGEVHAFDYRLQARYPAAVQGMGSQAYDYYAPDQRALVPPQPVTVTLGAP